MKFPTKETVKSLQAATKRTGKIMKKFGFTAKKLMINRQKLACIIGVDPGTNTGLAIKAHGAIKLIETLTIWQALNLVKEWAEYHGKQNTFVRVEDARQRVWFGKTGRERLKGAGSVERDCAIWEEVLTDLNIPFEMVHPKNVKETTAEFFAKISGWKGRTSKHSREAAFMILNF